VREADVGRHGVSGPGPHGSKRAVLSPRPRVGERDDGIHDALGHQLAGGEHLQAHATFGVGQVRVLVRPEPLVGHERDESRGHASGFEFLNKPTLDLENDAELRWVGASCPGEDLVVNPRDPDRVL